MTDDLVVVGRVGKPHGVGIVDELLREPGEQLRHYSTAQDDHPQRRMLIAQRSLKGPPSAAQERVNIRR